MKIGELAKLLNCTVETIRYYEKIGLIPPGIRDTNNNYRHYSEQHIDKLRFVRHCRALAMSHEEILQLLAARNQDEVSCEKIDQVIDQHLIHVSDRIHELQGLEKQLLELRRHCKHPGASHSCGIIQELESPANKIPNDNHKANHVNGSH